MISVGRVHLPIPDADWDCHKFKGFVERPAELRQTSIDWLAEYIARDWGPFGITDWLMKWARASDEARWPTIVSSLVTNWRDDWPVQPNREDIFGALLANLVSANNEPLRTELCTSLGQIQRQDIDKAISDQLYWPSGIASNDYLKAAEHFNSLVRSAPASTIYGALAEASLNTHCNGVLRIGVHLKKSETGVWALHVLPWSRYVPTSDALQGQERLLQAALRHAPEFEGIPPQDIFLNLQPVAVSNHKAVSHAREFEGESLGLPILLVLYAKVKKRRIDGWATGKIAGNGTSFGKVESVQGKAEALGYFLTDRSGGLAEVERKRFRLFVAGEANKNDVLLGLAKANADAFGGRTVIVKSVGELLQPDKLWDPFLLSPGISEEFFTKAGILGTTSFPKLGDEEFRYLLARDEHLDEATASETFGARLANKWIRWDEAPQRNLNAGEVLTCIPFHADTKNAGMLLRNCATRLAAYLRWRRALQQDAIASTLFPVPVVLEVSQWKPGRISLAEFLLPEAGLGPAEGLSTLAEVYNGNELRKEQLQEALSQEYRFCMILIDGNIDRSRLFEECPVGAEGRANEPFWNAIGTVLGHRPHTGVARQCLLLLAPDIHVQMFWKEQLQKKPFDLEFDPFDFDSEKY